MEKMFETLFSPIYVVYHHCPWFPSEVNITQFTYQERLKLSSNYVIKQTIQKYKEKIIQLSHPAGPRRLISGLSNILHSLLQFTRNLSSRHQTILEKLQKYFSHFSPYFHQHQNHGGTGYQQNLLSIRLARIMQIPTTPEQRRLPRGN